MLNVTPLIRNIIFICIAVFIVQRLVPVFDLTGKMALYKIGMEQFRPYQLFTYMFAHGSLGHLFFNMMALAFVGSYLEMVWGMQRLLTYIIATGIGASVIYTLIEYFLNPIGVGIMVGASGIIYGLLMAYGMLFPDKEIHLMFPPISVKGKYLVLVLGFFAYLTDQSGQVAHMAHLGGALVGFIMLKFIRF